MDNDKMISAIAFGGAVRINAAVTCSTVSEAVRIHNLTPVSAAALGRSLTGAVLMSNMLKNDTDKLTLQIKGDGPLGGIVVTGNKFGFVKGYVNNPGCDLPIRPDGKLDVKGAVGRGYLQVIKDIGLKEPYVGMVNLISGEIAEDLTYYFAVSEQINSAIGLGVLINPDGSVQKAGGYMIQLMPGAEEEHIAFLEKRLTELPTVTELIDEEHDVKNMVKKIFNDKEVIFLEERPCGYRCDCSREHMERNLISLGKKDIEELADEAPETEIVCHFCNSKYIFSSEELKNLLK